MAKKFELDDNVLVAPTAPTAVQKEEFEKVAEQIASPDPGAGVSMEKMYDQYSHLYYVVDASSSMSWGQLEGERVKQYAWSPVLLQAFRDRMDVEGWERDNDPVIDPNSDPDADEDFDNIVVQTQSDLSDESLKEVILDQDLESEYGISLPINRNFRATSRTKMDALKDAAKDFVRQRFQKFADAKVGIFKFNEEPKLLCAAGACEEEVLGAIGRITANGGTAINTAVKRALSQCRKAPSAVNLNHLVLVSDGEDGSAIDVELLIPDMKELGVVFDFIFMLGAGLKEEQSMEAKALRRVCEATGGEYTVVRTEKDFAQKLLAVSNRPMLPPARS